MAESKALHTTQEEPQAELGKEDYRQDVEHVPGTCQQSERNEAMILAR